MLLIIDNYDSFTYNLVQYFGEMGATMVIRRNDQVSLAEITKLKPDHICVSPGPRTPKEAGVSNDVVREFGFKSAPRLLPLARTKPVTAILLLARRGYHNSGQLPKRS